MNIDVEICSLRPRLIQRTCGGWLAVTPEEAGLQFGVTAKTEELARKSFFESLEKWIENLNEARSHPVRV